MKHILTVKKIKPRLKKAFFFALFSLLSISLLTGCFKKEINSNTLSVVSTTGMIHNTVVEIGGKHIKAINLMGPGVDPHLYTASEGDVTRLSKADVIFYNGLYLEAKLSDILKKMGQKKPVIAVGETIPQEKLIATSEFGGLYDPHIWFSIPLWIEVTKSIEATLINADPKNKEAYTKAAINYRNKLKNLHEKLLSKTKAIPKQKRILITAHDAFGYFGQSYGFKVKGLQGLSTQSEAGTHDVKALANFIVKRQIPAIFVESSISARKIKAVQAAVKAQGFAVEIGGELFSDAMGQEGTLEGTYTGMLSHNMDTIYNALMQHYANSK